MIKSIFLSKGDYDFTFYERVSADKTSYWELNLSKWDDELDCSITVFSISVDSYEDIPKSVITHLSNLLDTDILSHVIDTQKSNKVKL